MFISPAFAQTTGEAAAASADTFWMNMGLIGVMFVLFYLLLIRPQQTRMKEQREMLGALSKGDTVVTGGGLVGTISKIISDDQVEIDLGSSKVVAMRYTIQMKMDDAAPKPAATPAATEDKKEKKKPGRKPKGATAAAAAAKAPKKAEPKAAKAGAKKRPGRPKKSA